MATLRFRDRDAIVTKEGLIFRVFGYSHPLNACICDVEYAPADIFTSKNPKALRSNGLSVFYKFYEDEGLRFVRKHYPQHFFFHDMLRESVVGVHYADVFEVRKPEEKLREIMKTEQQDMLIAALRDVLNFTIDHSNLSLRDFGVFGSILHGFHSPDFSDLDFVIYSGKKAVKLRETLRELYDDRHSLLKNEFEDDTAIEGKRWRFQNYSAKEYVWHQKRKMIYTLFNCEKSGRLIKTEFEPVKDWNEIVNEYTSEVKVAQKGWVKMVARIRDDSDALFIPSIYSIEPLEVLNGAKVAAETVRIISYVEEFRLQAFKDETVYVEGNLEEVTSPKGSFHQITLTYCPRYYEQVLKTIS